MSHPRALLARRLNALVEQLTSEQPAPFEQPQHARPRCFLSWALRGKASWQH
ncbi:MAG: hypothetical protein R3E79_45680 [Caldilineaceae bacterium]